MEYLFFLVIIGLVYLFASAKSRRDAHVERRVTQMVRTNTSLAHFPELYFEPCKTYAIQHGGSGDSDGAIVDMLVDGQQYVVVFTKQRDGCSIGVENKEALLSSLMKF